MAKYQSQPVDRYGQVAWSHEDDAVWHALIKRQMALVEPRACKAYLDGLDKLNLPYERVAQPADINRILQQTTGWQICPVPALIGFERFFTLLADKQFPVATFMRTWDEFEYLQEPDYFHEIFGHCAMLTNQDFANFTEQYGKLGLAASSAERLYLARLYWFTVEFGLVKESQGTKIYGGGILSSPGETVAALESKTAWRHPFVLDQVLRTPYRIDIMQPEYFVLDSIEQLFHLSQQDLMAQVAKAMTQPLLPAKFPPKEQMNVG